jgi:hypothetical protein
MTNNQQSNSGWILLLIIVIAWFCWKNQQPNTDEMMLYYHNHILPGGLSEKNAEKLVQIANTYPHPEETFEKVIDFLAQYGPGNQVIEELNSTNKKYTDNDATLATAQGNVEMANFFINLENSGKPEKADRDDVTSESTGAHNDNSESEPSPVSDRATQVWNLLNEANNAFANKDYSQAAEYYDEVHDLIPEQDADVREKVSVVSDSIRELAASQTEAAAQTSLAAVKDLGPALTEVFKQWQQQRDPDGANTSSSDSPNLKRGDWITLTDRTALYFYTQFYRYGEKGESFEVYEYRPNERRLYILSKDANGNPIGLNIPRQ